MKAKIGDHWGRLTEQLKEMGLKAMFVLWGVLRLEVDMTKFNLGKVPSYSKLSPIHVST